MKAVIYKTIAETRLFKGAPRTVYGIAAYAESENTKNGTPLAFVSDLSCDPIQVERLAARCNQYGLSIHHLNNVAQDFSATE